MKQYLVLNRIMKALQMNAIKRHSSRGKTYQTTKKKYKKNDSLQKNKSN